MESPQMYDSTQPMVQVELKKITMAANNNNNNNATPNNNVTQNNNNNNSLTAINHNVLATKQQQHNQHQANNVANNTNNNNNNLILQKQMLQHYSQSDLEELTSQEISLDLQHLIDDQFRSEQESLGIYTEMVNSANGGNNNGVNTNGLSNNSLGKSIHVQSQRSQQNNQGFSRTTLPYMPQPVHTGATYTNSSDENSSVGSDVASSIKEEPVEPLEFRRQLAASGAGPFNTLNNNNNNGIYPIPPNYASNGSGNSFTTLPPSTVLHHQGLGHLGGGNHIGLKSKQMMNHRKQQNKHVDKGTDEYRRRRERNNIAVRKSREKAKVRSREVEEKVKTLIKEKDVLMRRLEEMTNEIQLHKQLYMHLMNHSNPEINQICRNVLNLVNMNDHGM